MSFTVDYLIQMLYTVPVLLIAFPIHEVAHGFAAYKLGDPTAKMMGRLSLNPFKHLDPIGTICLILFRFGWAKPVPVDPRYFKNPRAGMAVTALAGPLSNLILGFISIVLMELAGVAISANAFINANAVLYNISEVIYTFLFYSAWINISLCLFNLIPLPPLDGEKVLAFFLPEQVRAFFERNTMFIQFLLFFLLFTPVITRPLTYMVNNAFYNLDTLVKMMLSLI